tara:strand:+ start:536 stop:748 length:213 start_codon:yes stop_codon:yes gene_type:complete
MISSPYVTSFLPMSNIINEEILENLYDEVYEDFRLSNKLTVAMMDELLSFSKGTSDQLEKLTWERFEAMC